MGKNEVMVNVRKCWDREQEWVNMSVNVLGMGMNVNLMEASLYSIRLVS